MPALADVATSKLMVQQGYPRLTGDTPASLLPEFPRLIASMQEKWKEESGRKYVIEGDGLTLLGTMLTAYQPLDESTKRALASYMRAVLAQIDFKDQQTQLNMLAELLSPEQKLGIPEEVADSLGANFRSLADNLKPRVAIPTANTTNIQLTDEEANLLLAWSASRNLSDRGHWLLGGFVNDSLFNGGLHAAALSRPCWQAKCFPVKINNRREMFSLSDVRASLSMNRLIKSPIFQEVELLKALIEAVPRLHCAIVPNNVDDALAKLRLDKVPRCNEDFVFNFLSSQPDLNSLDNRLPLLKSLLKGDEWRGYTHAIRYLLHGSKEDTGVDPLFDVTGEREDESKVFSKVMIHILHQKDQAWRVVSDTVLKSLSGDQKDELRIGKMDTAQLEREICGNVDSLQSLTLNEDERTILLKKLFTEESSARATWYRLPYHKSLDGSLVSTQNAEKAFLTRTTGFAVPQRIASLVTLLNPGDKLEKTYDAHRIRQFTHWTTIQVAMEQPNPGRFYREILDTITALGEEFISAARAYQNSTNNSTIGKLKSVCWLPLTTDAPPTAPERIVNLVHIHDIVSDIVANASWANINVHEPGELAHDVRHHQSFRDVQELLFANTPSSFALLCEAVSSAADRYHVGRWPRGSHEGEAVDNVTEDYDRPNAGNDNSLRHYIRSINPPMLGLTLLKSILEIDEYKEYFDDIEGAISSRTNVEQLTPAIKCLQRESTAPDQPTKWLANQLLQECINEKAPVKLLEDVQLLNRKGEWRSCSELCADRFPQAGDEWKIDEEQQRIVSPIIPQDETAIGAPDSQYEGGSASQSGNPADLLRKYFAEWEGKVKRELIGVFLALLGDDPDIVKLADSHLGAFSPVRSVRDRLHGWIADRESRATGAGEDIHESMARQRVKIAITWNQGSRITVLNLLGEPIQVDTTQNPTSIFLDKRIRRTVEGATRIAQLQLVSVQIESKEGAQRLLEDAVKVVLESVYCRPQCKVEELWRLVSDTNQVDVRVAQHVILHNAFFYGKQLALANDSRMVDLCSKWREIEQQLAIDRVEQSGSDNGEHAAFLSLVTEHTPRFEQLTRELHDLFEGDNNFCNEILLAVREKIQQAQYKPTSIPFEIFQNADDALAEMRELNDDDVCKHFEVQMDERAVRWFHAGRPINTFFGTAKTREACIRLGYDQDLSKMLVLSTSDKNRQEGAVTGKFGLGFKSIFIASDEPHVLSGDLSFKIVGGAYPKLLDSENAGRLRELAEGIGAFRNRTTTVIEAPLIDGVSSDELLEEFRESARILPGFAREIRRINISTQKGAETYEWAVRPQQLGPGIDIADVTVPGEPKSIVLRINCDSIPGSAVVLSISTHGFEPLSKEVPTFWVTAPVRGAHKGAGFAVNAPFQIDIGRGQLATGDQNTQMARDIGAGAVKALASLTNAVERDWHSVRCRIDLREDLSAYDFWASLFQVYCDAHTIADTSGALGEILGNNGLGKLWLEQCVLPTELPAEYRRTIRFRDVKGLASGLLTDVNTFNDISRLPAFTNAFPPGSLIKKSTYERLACLHDHPNKPPDITLLTALTLAFTTHCDERSAAQIYGIVEPHLPDTTNEEFEAIRKWLKTLEFRNKGGSYQAAHKLLSTTHFMGNDTGKQEDSGGEEKLLAAFAPSDNLLSDDYDKEGTFLFRESRGTFQFEVAEVIRWGTVATGDQQRRAFLVYTVEGDLSTKMHLVSNGQSTWLGDVNSDELNRLDIAEDRHDEILAKLGKRTNEAPSTSSKPEPHRTATTNDLSKIYDWWQRDGRKHRSDYVDKLYPDEQLLAPISSEYGHTPRERTAWLVLLLRSALESVGRTKPGALSGFLTQIRDNGWLNWLQRANGTTTDMEPVFENIVGYLNSQISEIKYLNLIPYYVTTSIVATWIDEYAYSILGINGHSKTDEFHPLHFLNPRTNPGNRPGDSDAPPLSPVLGIGACFLLRELSRMGAIRNKMVYPYCFVPNKRVLNILEQCGVEVNSTDTRLDQSKDIYEQLCDKLGAEKATFDGSFDIPFQVLANNPEACSQVRLQNIDNDGFNDDDDD